MGVGLVDVIPFHKTLFKRARLSAWAKTGILGLESSDSELLRAVAIRIRIRIRNQRRNGRFVRIIWNHVGKAHSPHELVMSTCSLPLIEAWLRRRATSASGLADGNRIRGNLLILLD